MYLDLYSNGNIGSRYGMLVDAQGYRNLYGDSVSVVDTMRKRLEPYPKAPDLAYFDRNDLIRYDEDVTAADEEAGGIIVE